MFFHGIGWFGLVKDRALGPYTPGPPQERLRLRAYRLLSAVPRTMVSGASRSGPTCRPILYLDIVWEGLTVFLR